MANTKNRPDEPGYALDQGGPMPTGSVAKKKYLKRAKSLGQARREMKEAHAKGKKPDQALKDHAERVRKGVAYS